MPGLEDVPSAARFREHSWIATYSRFCGKFTMLPSLLLTAQFARRMTSCVRGVWKFRKKTGNMVSVPVPATVNGMGGQYYFSDHLGTSRVITTSTGAVCYDADYTPFGYEMAYTTSCTQNYKFTGMERDGETGNDHAWYRNYQWNLGRWMSPDLLGGDVTNPQSLNRYAYVLNNPTSLTDPAYATSHAECPSPPCDPIFGCTCDPSDPSCGSVWGGAGGGGGFPIPPPIPLPGGPSGVPGNADFGGTITCTQSSSTIGGVSYPGGPITCTITLSSGLSLPNININDLLAALNSAYGAGLGKAGQVFRGRPPGQSFDACIAQNARGMIGASAVTAMVGLESYLKQVPVGGGTLPASFVWLARGMGAVAGAMGVPGSEAGAGYILGAAACLSNAGAVLGSAGFGVLVGSAANCMSEGVNP
jgi:RHS repeat-associated protein